MNSPLGWFLDTIEKHDKGPDGPGTYYHFNHEDKLPGEDPDNDDIPLMAYLICIALGAGFIGFIYALCFFVAK